MVGFVRLSERSVPKDEMVNVPVSRKHRPLFILNWPGTEKEFRRVMQQVRKQHLHTIIKMKAFDSRVSLFYKVNNLLKISKPVPRDYHNNCPLGPVSRKQPVNCVIMPGIKANWELRTSVLFSTAAPPATRYRSY